MGSLEISLMTPVPAALTVETMPSISSRSAAPEMVSALTAVRGFSWLRSSRMPNSVHSSPSQKKSIRPRWSDSSAPLSMDRLSHSQN